MIQSLIKARAIHAGLVYNLESQEWELEQIEKDLRALTRINKLEIMCSGVLGASSLFLSVLAINYPQLFATVVS